MEADRKRLPHRASRIPLTQDSARYLRIAMLANEALDRMDWEMQQADTTKQGESAWAVGVRTLGEPNGGRAFGTRHDESRSAPPVRVTNDRPIDIVQHGPTTRP